MIKYLRRRWCGDGRLGGGHKMSIVVVPMGYTYLIDPLVTCENCGMPAPEKVTESIQQMVEGMHREGDFEHD